MEETERSLHDAIMIVRRAMKNDAVVAGGGAIEMELSKYLRDCSRLAFVHISNQVFVVSLSIDLFNFKFRILIRQFISLYSL